MNLFKDLVGMFKSRRNNQRKVVSRDGLSRSDEATGRRSMIPTSMAVLPNSPSTSILLLGVAVDTAGASRTPSKESAKKGV
jgi:hypothetical protein